MGDIGELWESKGTGGSCGIVGADHHVRETRREKGIMVAARKCKKNSVRMTKLWGKVGIWGEELWRTRALWKRTELCGRTLGETRNCGGLEVGYR